MTIFFNRKSLPSGYSLVHIKLVLSHVHHIDYIYYMVQYINLSIFIGYICLIPCIKYASSLLHLFKGLHY